MPRLVRTTADAPWARVATRQVFSIGPSIFDLVAASVYIGVALQPWIAVIVFVTLVSYIPLTIYLTEWRGKYRRWGQAAAAVCGVA